MVYAADTFKLALAGSMPGGTRFSFGWQWSGTSGAMSTRADAAVGSVVIYLNGGGLNDVAHIWSTTTVVDTVSCYGYSGGKTASAISSASIHVAGTGGGVTMPDQVALVASIRSRNNTRSGRGRMYLPASGVLADQGQVAGANCQAIADAIKGLLLCGNGTGSGLPFKPVVASLTHGSNQDAVQVIVDSRLDVVRHRAQGQTVLRTAYSNLS